MMSQFKIVSIDGIMFGFKLDTGDGIKLVIIENNYLCSLIGYSKIYQNGNVGGSLNIFDWRWNFTC